MPPDPGRQHELQLADGINLTDQISPALVVGTAVLYVIGVEPGYHAEADHHDPIGYGVEVGLALALLFVGGRLVAGRWLGS